MSDKKFLFVTCVNNTDLYQRCLSYINTLTVPVGYSVETLPVTQAKSMASGYNQALQNKAKYKVYLHQDTFISNTNFLHDVLELFQANLSLGPLGVVGVKQLAPGGVWWEGKEFVGRLYGCPDGVNKSDVLFGDVRGAFDPVQAVDGLLMVTQYDVPWREDLFQGFHFYDTSQAMEFIRKGYLVGIPNQKEPWCIHIGNDTHSQINSIEFQADRETFRMHYKLR